MTRYGVLAIVAGLIALSIGRAFGVVELFVIGSGFIAAVAAALVYVLLRYLGHLSGWPHQFSRLCTMIRAILWDKLALQELLVAYGTAGGLSRMCGRPEQAYFPGFG